MPDNVRAAQETASRTGSIDRSDRIALELLNASVVVTAEAHNPSILHPSFLSSEGIVPAKWETAEPPICTPALSIVKYRNGIVFTVESGKFQVLQNAPVDIRSDVVRTLASRYVQKLPHVRYTAIGVNLTGLYETKAAERMVIERFIKPGPWNAENLRLTSSGVRFAYTALGGVFRLSFDPGTITNMDRPEEKSGVIVAGNYSYSVDASAPMKTALAAIDRYDECVKHFSTVVSTVFESKA